MVENITNQFDIFVTDRMIFVFKRYPDLKE